MERRDRKVLESGYRVACNCLVWVEQMFLLRLDPTAARVPYVADAPLLPAFYVLCYVPYAPIPNRNPLLEADDYQGFVVPVLISGPSPLSLATI